MPRKKTSTDDFVSLLTDHQQAVRGLIFSMAPNCQDINDILQDVNMVLWKKRGSYTKNTNFKAWAYSIARIKVMQYWDKQKRLGKITLSNEFVDSVEDTRQNENFSHLQEKLKILNHCLSLLKQKERHLLEVRYSKAMTLENYAQQTGSTEGSLKVTLHRIRHKLKICAEENLTRKIS